MLAVGGSLLCTGLYEINSTKAIGRTFSVFLAAYDLVVACWNISSFQIQNGKASEQKRGVKVSEKKRKKKKEKI